MTNYSEKFGQEAEDDAKRAANLKSEQPDDELSDGDDEPLMDEVPERK